MKRIGKRIVRWALAASALVVMNGVTFADDVDFSGSLTNECTLTLTTAGSLAMATDGGSMSSTETGGISAVISVLSLGTNTLTINAPSLISTPAGYDSSGEVVEVAYVGAAGLSAISQSMTDQTTNHALGAIPLSALNIDARITNPNGFTAGTYTARAVVTCS